MTKFVINPKSLAAAATASSTDKTRYYLMGVRVKAEAGETSVRYEATNGHLLIQASAEGGIDGEPLEDSVDIIVSTSAVKRIVAYDKANRSPIPNNLVATVEGGRIRVVNIAEGDDVVIDTKLIDGTFPDTGKVIPNLDAVTTPTPEVGFNLNYVTAIGKAVKLHTGQRTAGVKLKLNSTPEAACRFEASDFLAVLMPMRV